MRKSKAAKQLSILLFLSLVGFITPKATADVGDISRLHSDEHAQVRQIPSNEGKYSSPPNTTQRQVGH